MYFAEGKMYEIILIFSSHDVPERTITVVRYSQEGESPLRPAGTTEYTCNLKRQSRQRLRSERSCQPKAD